MLETLMLLAGGTGIVMGHLTARSWVRRRLRFVDAVQGRAVPIALGIGAALVAAPVVWVLPVLGEMTALLFGVAVGTGVARGARDIRLLNGA